MNLTVTCGEEARYEEATMSEERTPGSLGGMESEIFVINNYIPINGVLSYIYHSFSSGYLALMCHHKSNQVTINVHFGISNYISY